MHIETGGGATPPPQDPLRLLGTLTGEVPDKLLRSSATQLDAIFRTHAQGTLRESVLPELFVLLGHPHASAPQSLACLRSLMDTRACSETQEANLLRAIALVGTLSFSFPVWRFLSMGRAATGERYPSLLEQAGMVRLERKSDKYPGAEQKDRLGVAYISTPGTDSALRATSAPDLYVEYRRANLLAHIPSLGTILIRNSSRHFGRDRFRYPLYVDTAKRSIDELQTLTEIDVDQKHALTPITAIAPTAIEPLRELVSQLMRFELNLSAWLSSAGLPALLQFLERKQTEVASLPPRSVPRRAMPILAWTELLFPPWYPQHTLRVEGLPTNVLQERVRAFASRPPSASSRLALLSGVFGDFP